MPVVKFFVCLDIEQVSEARDSENAIKSTDSEMREIITHKTNLFLLEKQDTT